MINADHLIMTRRRVAIQENDCFAVGLPAPVERIVYRDPLEILAVTQILGKYRGAAERPGLGFESRIAYRGSKGRSFPGNFFASGCLCG
jgi:hypothetical protein